MKAAFAKKWVAALRSGQYSQCKEKLHDGVGFCCLGVACDIAGKKFVYDSFKGNWQVDDDWQVLPPSVQNEAGMQSKAGQFLGPEDGKTYLLSELNDEGRTFNEIADIIEKNYEQL